MATYLQGVTDYIPEIQPFQPDYNFYLNVLETKQNQYDTNYKNINNLYGQLHDSAVTRDDSAKMKDDYLKKIDFELKRVSGLDLSLEQNVQQATQVFKPFYENKHLIKDIALTKNYNNEVGMATSLLNSKDEKERARYWDVGVKAMQMRLEEFKNADASEVLSFSNISYTPYVNAQKKYFDLAKEYNISVDITQPDKSGMYMVRQKNGELIIPTLQKLFLNTYVNDPELQRVYATEAYVKRKSEIESRAVKFNGDKKAAEKDYLQEQYRHLSNFVSEKSTQSDEKVTVENNKKNSVENDIEKGDVHPKQGSYLQRIQQSLEVESFIKDHNSKLNEQLNGQSNTVNTQGLGAKTGGLDLDNLELSRDKIDSGYANLLAQEDILGAANDYSKKDMIYDTKVNPIGLENMRHSHNMRRDAAQNAFTMQRDKMKYDFEIAKLKDQQKHDEKLAIAKAKFDEEKLVKEHLLSIGAAEVDAKGNIIATKNTQKTEPIGPMNTGNVTVNWMKHNRDYLFKTVDKNATGYANNFINLISSGIEGSNPEIDRVELANILGTTPDKALQEFRKIKEDFKRDKSQTVRNLTLQGKLFNMKDKMDQWAYANDGTSISRNYLSKAVDSGNFEEVRQFFRVYKETKRDNYKVIQKDLSTALVSANLSDQANREIVKLYNEKYLQGKINADKFEDLVEDFIIGRLDKKGKGVGKGPQTKMVTKTRKDPFGVTETYTESVPTHETNGAAILKLLNNAYNNTVTNANNKIGMKTVAPTKMQGKGKGSLAAVPTSIDVNLGWKGSDGYQYFAQTVEDINKISFSNQDGLHGISIDGPNKSGKIELDKENAGKFNKYKRLANDLLYLASQKQKDKPVLFKLLQHQIAFEDENAGAMTIKFPREFLEKHIKDGDYKISAEELEKIYNNGITYVAPKTSWKNQMFQSNEIDPSEAMLNLKGKMTYVDPNNGGNFVLEKDPQSGSIRYNIKYHIADENGNIIPDQSDTESLTLGKNIYDTKLEFLSKIEQVNEYNRQMFQKFHQENNEKAIANMTKFFGSTPKNSGYSY